MILFVITFIADANEHKYIFRCLPHCVHCNLLFGHVVLNSHLLRESVNIILSVWIISQIISFKHPLLVVSGFEPTNHWVWVTFFRDVFVSPFIVFGFINIKWFIIWPWWIIIIRQLVSIVVISTKLLNTKIFSISESLNFSLIRFFVKKMMRRSSELMLFKVKNSNAISSCFNHDGFSFA